jgi:GNAT superfamily N-acetyltransferase
MSEWPTFIEARDLAPGDLIPHKDLPQGLELCRIESPGDPLFELAYLLLEEEFGRANEIETRQVLMNRLQWRADQAGNSGMAMSYELIVLKVAGEVAAVRDHSAIVSGGEVTVHMSHVLVLPNWRRRGLATILRTIPVGFARNKAALAGLADAPVTLFCEMEPCDGSDPANRIRRASYEKAGFLTIPTGHGYLQPDFRAAERIELDTNGSRPVSLDLVFRRVGRETESEMSGSEFIGHVERIYEMYGRSFMAEHMAPCERWFVGLRNSSPDRWPLLLPTAEQ